MPLGTRMPVYPTSLGRVLLASQPEEEIDNYFKNVSLREITPFTITDEKKLRDIIAETKVRGWVSTDRDMQSDLRSVGVPIHDAQGKVAAALNTNTLAHQLDIRHIEKNYVPVLLEVSAKITNMIVHSGN